MTLHKRFAKALKLVRKERQLTQEDFSEISSRTYLSSLERGLKSPTLEKLEQLAGVLEIHPASLIVLAYAGSGIKDVKALCDRIVVEIGEIEESGR